MTYTGGELNWLNGQCGASNPAKSVHVMSLVREHQPDSPDELYEEINRHYHENCDCGIQSGGTVEEFGEWLYEAQDRLWNEYRYTREECIEWEYDLFVVQSLKGHNLERRARTLFEESFDIVDPSDEADNEYQVDLIIEHDDEIIAGIQVKPESYRDVRDDVKRKNDRAHDRIDEPVLYCYYDYDSERFTNAEYVLEQLYDLVE